MSDIDTRHCRLIEAALFASPEPLTERKLANCLPEGADLKGILKDLRAQYEDRGVNLVRAGKSWAFRTAPDVANLLNTETNVARKLSRAAIETLAIIAYHQPVTRGEIEEIRGVGLSKGTLDLLFEEGWIRPRGRRKTPGRPMQWATTDGFLDHFGLETLRDLPGMDDLKAAGLLDARPAIEAYGIHGDMAPAKGGDEAEDEGEDAVSGPTLLGAGEDEDVPEPLNPTPDGEGETAGSGPDEALKAFQD